MEGARCRVIVIVKWGIAVLTFEMNFFAVRTSHRTPTQGSQAGGRGRPPKPVLLPLFVPNFSMRPFRRTRRPECTRGLSFECFQQHSADIYCAAKAERFATILGG